MVYMKSGPAAALNAFVLELFKGRDTKRLEQALENWRHETTQLQETLPHPHPTQEFEDAKRTYLEQYATLRKAYENSTLVNKKNALYEWLSLPVPDFYRQ